jgi:hypothetical protein
MISASKCGLHRGEALHLKFRRYATFSAPSCPNLMNNRPRKTLGWRTPAEAMADEIAAFKSTVALDV